MNPGDAMPVVFLSYAGSQREQAHAIKAGLEQRGIRVVIDANFESGESILVNIGEAIGSDVVVALMSSDYLDRKYTQIEISAAIANDVKVVQLQLEGHTVRPATERGRNLWRVLHARTHKRINLTEESFDELADEIRRQTRAGAPAAQVLTGADDGEDLVIALLYDWEDSNVVDDAAYQCLEAGVTVADISGAGVPLPDDLPASVRVGILWTSAAQSSPEVGDAVISAVSARRRVIYLTNPGGPAEPAGGTVLRLGLLRAVRPRPAMPTELLWSRDRAQLQVRVDESIRLNKGVPFHLVGDRFCASRESAAAAADTYEVAVHQFRAFDETRLQAVLAHAAACRFRGDWQVAADVLAREPLPGNDVPDRPAALAVEAERLSLDFELGLIFNGTPGRANGILSSALAAGEWSLIIAAHRQLGMIREERGEYRVARDHLDRACHYAEDLLDTPSLAKRITTNEARRALRADCLRELAAVEWRDGESGLAREHLDLAGEVLRPVQSNPAADYLLNVIAYQQARVSYSIDHDYEAARTALRASYQALQKYDNPVRLATVLESLVQLEMDFIRRDDAAIAKLRPTLEKVRRVRQVRRHNYMIARTTRALGDLEFALGNYSEAKGHYTDARQEFNRLGKNPETATTLRYLSRCDARLGNSEAAIRHLDEAMDELEEPDHHATLAEIRSEKARLRHRRLRHDQVTNANEMTEVGEFAVHDWIASGLLSTSVDDSHVVVGVGDDGAVLRPGAEDDVIVTTDSVPPSMLTDDSHRTASFSARFAVVTTLADVIAMGGEPKAVLLNLHLRRTTSASWAHTFLERAAEEAAAYGAVVVGGDLRERGQKALTVTGVGRTPKGRAITRKGASAGDLLALTLSSSPGHQFSGLGTRWALELARHLSGDEVSLIRPLADRDATFTDLGLPHRIMRAVSDARLATSAIDTSDGLLACAELIGQSSGVGIEFFPEEIGRLIDPDVARLARRLGIAPLMFAFSAGYDWEVLLTVPRAREEELRLAGDLQANSTYQNVAIIGRVVEREPWASAGVHLAVRNEQPVLLPFFTGEKFLPQPYLLRARGWLEFAKESTRRIPHEVSELDSA